MISYNCFGNFHKLIYNLNLVHRVDFTRSRLKQNTTASASKCNWCKCLTRKLLQGAHVKQYKLHFVNNISGL